MVKYCYACGSAIEDSAIFCHKCGIKYTVPPTEEELAQRRRMAKIIEAQIEAEQVREYIRRRRWEMLFGILSLLASLVFWRAMFRMGRK